GAGRQRPAARREPGRHPGLPDRRLRRHRAVVPQVPADRGRRGQGPGRGSGPGRHQPAAGREGADQGHHDHQGDRGDHGARGLPGHRRHRASAAGAGSHAELRPAQTTLQHRRHDQAGRGRSRRPQMSTAMIDTFEAAASRYDRSGAQFAGPVAEQLVALAGLRPGDRVLDVGCGPGGGATPPRCARAVVPGGQVTGLDLSEGMLRRTAAEAAALGFGHVNTRRGDAARPPFAPPSFDVVLASLVLYLLPDTRAALRNWRDQLRPGGRLGFSWGIRPDPRWSPVFAAVDAFARRAVLEGYGRRLGPPAAMSADLAGAGCTGIEVATRTIDVRYTGPRQWWQASW